MAGNPNPNISAVGNVDAAVQDWAEADNDETVPKDKLPADTVYSDAIANFQTQSQVDVRVATGVADWAEAGNSDAIPAAKLANAASGNYETGTSFPASPSEGDLFEFNDAVASGLTAKDFDGSTDLTTASRGDLFKYIGTSWVKQSEAGAGGTGLNQAQVNARVAAGVLDWAETGNTDAIPAAKLGNAPMVQVQRRDEVEVEDSLAILRVGGGVVANQVSDGLVSLSLGVSNLVYTGYVGVSNDTTIEAGDIQGAASSTGDTHTVPTYTGSRHIFVVRPASIGDVSQVYVYSPNRRNTYNQINSWTAVPAFTANGVSYVGVVSTVALSSASGLIVEVL